MSALYFREPTEEEKLESGIKEPFTVLDKERTAQAQAEEVKDSKYYLDKIMRGDFI